MSFWPARSEVEIDEARDADAVIPRLDPSLQGSDEPTAAGRTMLPPPPTGDAEDLGQRGLFPRAPRVPVFGRPDPERATRLHERAVQELESGRYTRASVRASQAVEVLEQLDGVEALDRAEVRLTLARSLSAEGKLEEANATSRIGLRLLFRRRSLGARRARCHLKMVLAQIANKQGQYAQARGMLLTVQREARRAFSDGDPIFGSIANDLGVVCKWAGRFEEAEAHYREVVLRLRGRSKGDPVALATLYHNLAGLDHARGHYRRGVSWARRGLTLRERALGQNHPDVAADCAALASLLQGQGQLEQAETHLRRAIAIFRQRPGTDPSELASALASLAALCYARNDFAEAERCCRRAFRLQSKQLGDEHPSTATTLGNWAAIAARRGALERASLLNQRALNILETSLGTEHPTVAVYWDNQRRYDQLSSERAQQVKSREPAPRASLFRVKDEPQATTSALVRASRRGRS